MSPQERCFGAAYLTLQIPSNVQRELDCGACEEFTRGTATMGHIHLECVPNDLVAWTSVFGSMHPNSERLRRLSSWFPLDCACAWSKRASCSRRYSLSFSVWPQGPW